MERFGLNLEYFVYLFSLNKLKLSLYYKDRMYFANKKLFCVSLVSLIVVGVFFEIQLESLGTISMFNQVILDSSKLSIEQEGRTDKHDEPFPLEHTFKSSGWKV